MNRRLASIRNEWRVTAPSFLWLLFFVALPTFLIFLISFRKANPAGGVAEGWSLTAWKELAEPYYLTLAWRTIWISVVVTTACLTLALPVAWFLARCHPKRLPLYLLLIIVPFWTNFLIRVFAWNQVLHAEGLLANALRKIGLLEPNASLLFHPGTVVLISVYAFLPFAILPLYAAASRFDFTLLDAARDLGCTRWQAISRVFLPGISKGILTALLIVLIPMLGSYVIPDLVGGTDGEMIGNRIAQRTERNLPAAAALSTLVSAFLLLPLLFRRKSP